MAINRYSIAKKGVYMQFLNREDKFFILVQEQLGLEEVEYRNLDKLDRALACKISHFSKYVLEKLVSLTGDLETLQSQLTWIVALAMVEAIIGMPDGTNQKSRVMTFFKNNLTGQQKITFLKGLGRDGDDVELAIKELVNRRHGFVHRAELINLPTKKFPLILSASVGRRGRKGRAIVVTLTPKQIERAVKNAIKTYLLTSNPNRKPAQDLRLWNKKTKSIKSNPKPPKT